MSRTLPHARSRAQAAPWRPTTPGHFYVLEESGPRASTFWPAAFATPPRSDLVRSALMHGVSTSRINPVEIMMVEVLQSRLQPLGKHRL